VTRWWTTFALVAASGPAYESSACRAPYPQAVVAFDLGESVGKDTPPCA